MNAVKMMMAAAASDSRSDDSRPGSASGAGSGDKPVDVATLRSQDLRLDALYKDIILDHNRDPRNFIVAGAPAPECDAQAEGFNPMCGDRVKLYVKYGPGEAAAEGGARVLAGCWFSGEGCSICMSSASILTEDVTGVSVAAALGAIEDFRALMQGKKPPQDFEGDIEALAGVRAFPVRIKCALLGWTTLKGILLEKGQANG